MAGSEVSKDENALTGIEEMIDARITARINMFHDAMVDRGQIRPIPPKEEWPIHRKQD